MRSAGLKGHRLGHVRVTGGTGNIGMYAVAEFMWRGHAVTVLDQKSESPMLAAIAPEANVVARRHS